MADHARNTDCNVAPTTRRALLRGSAAALTGLGLAAAVLSPDPDWSSPAPAAADDHLLALSAAYYRAHARVAVCQAAVKDDDSEEYEIWEEACEARDAAADLVRDTPPRTLAGLVAKARVAVSIIETVRSPEDGFNHEEIFADQVLEDLIHLHDSSGSAALRVKAKG